MRTRNLIILTAVVIGLAAFIWFYERHQPTSDEARERADKVFPSLERDDVATVSIRNSHGQFNLAKAGEEWLLTGPIDFPADTAAVNSLIGSLVNLSVERRLAPDEVDATSYGLDQPELRVALATADGERFELDIGDETALGSNRAVRRTGDDGIILCRRWFVTDIDKGLDDWRSRDVVRITADQVASLQVVAGSDRIHAVRDGEEWRLLEPVSDLADRDHLRSLISNLNSLRVEEFVGADTDPAAMGLDTPQYGVTLVRTEGSAPVELEFGASRERDGATQVACRRGGTDMFWVNDVAATRLAKAPVLWRSQKVYGFDTWDAERLVLTIGDAIVRLDRSEGLWQLGDGGEVDYTAVQDRLSKLANLEVLEFDLMAPPTAQMGEVELELKSNAGDEASAPKSVRYTFHRPLEAGGDAILTTSVRSTVMSVPAEDAEAVLADPETLRKREVPPIEESGEE